MGELFGIHFAPLFIPLERRLQSLVAGLWIYSTMLGLSSPLICVYLLFFTKYGWIFLLPYGVWIYLDRKVGENGGRRSQWLRKHKMWTYYRDYFPITLTKLEGAEYDTSKNHLLCVFPHGILASGFFGCFGTEACGFYKKFAGFEIYPVVLSNNFITPFFREWCIAQGGVASSEKSLNYLLGNERGGNFVALIVGGAEETLHCRPGKYTVILNKRRGFVRLALKHGTPLVPVFSFGETDIYTQPNNPPGSLMRYAQDAIKKITGVALTVPMGRGFFQYTFGPIPQRKPITTVVGKPLEMPKISNPSKEIIDEYHKKFKEALIDLFEKEKHKYVKDSEDVKLTIL